MRKSLKNIDILRFASVYKTAVQGPALSPNFWIRFVQMAQRLGVHPYELAAVINSESGFNPAAQNIQNGRIIAQGLNQLIRTIATKTLEMSDELWENFSKLPPEEHLKWTEKFFNKFGTRLKGKSAGDIYLMNFGGFNNPDGSLYASKEAQERYKQTHPDAEFKNSDYQQKAIDQNAGLVDSSGRIMPSKVKSMVASGPPSGIKTKIDDALRATQGQSLPGYEEPNPNWTGSPTSMSNTPAQPQQTPSSMQEDPGDIEALENALWFQ